MERPAIKEALLSAYAAQTVTKHTRAEIEDALDIATPYEAERLQAAFEQIREAEARSRLAARTLHDLFTNIGNKAPVPRP